MIVDVVIVVVVVVAACSPVRLVLVSSMNVQARSQHQGIRLIECLTIKCRQETCSHCVIHVLITRQIINLRSSCDCSLPYLIIFPCIPRRWEQTFGFELQFL